MPASASSGQGSIEWFYDATGRKLRKVSGTNSVTNIDGIEKYDNGSTFIMHPEGRSAVIPNGEHPLPWHVEFTLCDHLGNTRVAFSDLNEDGGIQLAGTDPSGVPIPEDYTELLQENHYYPFGLNMEGKWYRRRSPSGRTGTSTTARSSTTTWAWTGTTTGRGGMMRRLGGGML